MARTTDDLQAIRIAIGGETRERFSEALGQPLPAEMTELLKQLDHEAEAGSDSGSASSGCRSQQRST